MISISETSESTAEAIANTTFRDKAAIKTGTSRSAASVGASTPCTNCTKWSMYCVNRLTTSLMR